MHLELSESAHFNENLTDVEKNNKEEEKETRIQNEFDLKKKKNHNHGVCNEKLIKILKNKNDNSVFLWRRKNFFK